MPLKRHDISFQTQTGNKVTPDEIDRYEVYTVANPAISATFFGTATAGTVSQVVAIGLGNTQADYPRSIAAVFSGSASLSGTVAVTGKDQFGIVRTESLALAQGTQWVGTANSAVPFARVTAATATFGTGVVGTGTVSLGVAIAGTAALFGLPVKIAGTTDVKSITWTTAGLAVALNGGTVGAYVGTTNHTFAGTETLAGTMTLQAWVKSTWKAKGDSMATIARL